MIPTVGWLQDRQALDGELGSGSTREAHIRLRIVCDGNDARTRLGRNIKVIVLRIEAAALPKRTPGTAGIVPGALSAVFLDLRRRLEKRTKSVLLGDSDRLGAEFGREVDEVILDIALVFVRRRLGRMRLCRPRTLAGHVACGHPTLFDRPDGLAGHAVEYICVALLGKLHERPYSPPRHSDIHQGRSRRGNRSSRCRGA